MNVCFVCAWVVSLQAFFCLVKEYNHDDILSKYIDLMTTPDAHNDTYAGTGHRMFFANYIKVSAHTHTHINTHEDSALTYTPERHLASPTVCTHSPCLCKPTV